MKRILTIFGIWLLPNAAQAGCASFLENPDDAPAYQICYGDACDLTTLDYACPNVTDYRAQYAIGWSVRCTITAGQDVGVRRYFWQDRPIDPAKYDFITITEVD
ncbi:hypothetical protein FHS72_001097 [Loktanella ponticola]|uniref:Secreted protein n=1 Tax=Yoonia ponticola TaxID=1524255 RepID=A0A7W9BJ57_9RHOB|nr:hypothetical protein [Yoonia ponticola]MBB5721485.1 hypothetical protein [Yoonia ponticola]